jgi:hypothetical protein
MQKINDLMDGVSYTVDILETALELLNFFVIRLAGQKISHGF